MFSHNGQEAHKPQGAELNGVKDSQHRPQAQAPPPPCPRSVLLRSKRMSFHRHGVLGHAVSLP